MSAPAPASPDRAHARRIVAVARAWAAPGTLVPDDGAAALALLFESFESALATHDDAAIRRLVFLLHVGVSGTLPRAVDVLEGDVLARTAGVWALHQHLTEGIDQIDPARASREVEAADGVLVDVSITARSLAKAGIPRVVRNLARRWEADRSAVLVVWDAGLFRTLNATERAQMGLPAPREDAPPPRWLVPWNATLVVTEVLRPEAHAQAVGALALVEAAEVVGVAYDLAALTDPTTTSDATTGSFLHYLQSISAGSRLSAISASAHADFAAFLGSVERLGRTVPEIRTQPLPMDVPPPTPDHDALAARLDAGWGPLPVVLSVSSLQPRKNHLRTLAAAERLWSEGLVFQLVFVEGTHQQWPAFEATRSVLAQRDRPVRVVTDVEDDELWAYYRAARCTVFVSLAEGYGLPAAESLAAGTPVVVSRHGSVAEIMTGGGALGVEPTDIEGIADALRTLLTDDAVRDELARAAAARTWPTWDAYAADVWDWLVGGAHAGTEATA